jgi:hypothetical protein
MMMGAGLNPTVEYKPKHVLIGMDGGYQIQYICALCSYHYTTGWIKAGSETVARGIAEREARRFFNGCHDCGRWVCDDHYDMKEMLCLTCSEKNRSKAKKG